MAAPPRENYQDEAEEPFLAERPDPRIREWGAASHRMLGPAGLCWHNARQVARSSPGEYLVAEGLAFNFGEWSGHGWVVRKSDCAVVECTSGYETATRYRGICFEVADIDAFIGQPSHQGGVARLEQWRTNDLSGAVLSEAPGIITILAHEYVNMSLHWEAYWVELQRWLDSGKCPP